MNVRPAAVAGQFYPDDPVVLNQTMEVLLQAVPAHTRTTQIRSRQRMQSAIGANKPRALIVPHAGYQYSGTVAAAAYAGLQPGDYRRVLLLGPAHRVLLHGMALPEADAFATPLGLVPIAQAARQQLLALPQVSESARAHAQEHSLEVQLPFLQHQLGNFELIPLLVGDCSPSLVAAAIQVVHDDDTLLIVSTDLSHFHSEAEAHQLDGNTIAQILSGTTKLVPEQACGAIPLNGLLQYCGQQVSALQLLANETSADHGGPRNRVVGYASFRWH